MPLRGTERREAVRRLAAAVREVAEEKRDALERLKATARRRRKDPAFVWTRLLGAYATLAGSSAYHRIIGEDERPVAELRFEKLLKDPEKREEALHCKMRAAGVVWSRKKARWAAAAFELIAAEGGPEKVTAELFCRRGAEEKIRFLQRFPGVGPKYARDIMMDAWDPDFRDTVAVDSRLEGVAQAIGVDLESDYAEKERFFQDVAREAGLTGWELDRTMYEFTDEVYRALGVPPKGRRKANPKACRGRRRDSE